MDIKFVEDFKKSQMRLTIKLAKRIFAKEKDVLFGWPRVEKIVEEQYECPSTHVLGECSNPHQKMNNNHDNMLERTWIFDLIPKQSSKKSKTTVTTVNKAKKTTVKK